MPYSPALHPAYDPAPVASPPAGARPVATVQLEIVIPALNEERRIASTLAAVGRYLGDLPFPLPGVGGRQRQRGRDGGAGAGSGRVPRRRRATDRLPGSGQGRRGPGRGAGRPRPLGRLLRRRPRDPGRRPGRGPGSPGARRAGGDRQPPVRRRRLRPRAARGAPRRRVGVPTDDPQPRPRRGRHPVRLQVLPARGGRELFADVASAGFTFDLELLAAAARRSIPVVEVPVRWTDQDGSTLRPLQHGREVLREVRALRRRAGFAREDEAA